MKLGGFTGPAIAILVPYFLFVLIRISPYDFQYAAPLGHFYIVSSVAVLATIIGVSVGVAGNRLRNMKVCFLSLSFISLAGIFSIHGLSTPGFLLHASHLPGVSGQLSILMATLWLWLSSLSADHKLIDYLSRWKDHLMMIWVVLLGVFAIVAISFPHLTNHIPLDRNPLKWPVTVGIACMNVYTLTVYFRSYRYSKFPLQLSIVYSAGWLIVAQMIVVHGELWRLSWWLYHFLLLFSMIAMLVGLVKQYAANQSIIKGIHALYTTDPVERITNSISPSVKALILATESKDTYTAGHNFRVTMYALRIGEALKLQPEQLRALVQGSIIHDVGKINIPDSILNKPGKLTEEERGVIELHPVKGYEMCRNLGFMKEELQVIRSHHERWDGKGYPDRLQGEEIPMLARIVAVADVYDALTSTRAYRQAWTHEEAITFLHNHKGTQFDPVCVDVWKRLCEREPEVYRFPSTLMNGEGSNA